MRKFWHWNWKTLFSFYKFLWLDIYECFLVALKNTCLRNEITNYLIFIGQTFSRPYFELGRLSFRKFEEIGFETFAARPGLDNLDGKNQMKKWLRQIIYLPFSSLSSV